MKYIKFIFKYSICLIIICLISSIFWVPYTAILSDSTYPPLDILDKSILKQGKEELKKHKVLIAGISRDNFSAIKHVIKRIENLGSEFADYRAVIFENDSSDGTKLTLWFWQILNNKVTILSEDFKNKKRPSIKFLADLRNKYIDYLKDKHLDFDIVFIIDMDMKKGWDMRGIYDSFARIDKWDAVCANGIHTKHGNMWDAFAFRNDEFNKTTDYPNFWEEVIPPIQKIYLPGTELIKVKSCFGGMAFYKRKVIDSCRYDSINEDCEHVFFHDCISAKNNGTMYMNPNMIIKYRD